MRIWCKTARGHARCRGFHSFTGFLRTPVLVDIHPVLREMQRGKGETLGRGFARIFGGRPGAGGCCRGRRLKVRGEQSANHRGVGCCSLAFMAEFGDKKSVTGNRPTLRVRRPGGGVCDGGYGRVVSEAMRNCTCPKAREWCTRLDDCASNSPSLPTSHPIAEAFFAI